MQFFERSKAVMQDLDDTAQSVSGAHRGLQGTVRLALPMSFGHLHVLPTLMPFFQESKDLVVHMDLDDRHVDLAADRAGDSTRARGRARYRGFAGGASLA